jgi:hypothetical protein
MQVRTAYLVSTSIVYHSADCTFYISSALKRGLPNYICNPIQKYLKVELRFRVRILLLIFLFKEATKNCLNYVLESSG